MEGRRAFEEDTPSAAPRDELLFGDEALALEARALPSCVPGLPHHPEATGTIRCALRLGVLPEPTRGLLAGVAAEIRPTGSGSLDLLLADEAALRELSRRLPAAALVLAAHEAAGRPRRAPRVMGILNVTPDSFSDGGQNAVPDRAVEQGLKLLAQGAEVLDVGGESTRPGAPPVPADLERERVLPVIEALARETGVPISIDTTKAGVARDALAAGASIVNDVSAGLLDPQMFAVVAASGAELVLMHMQGTPRTMQVKPRYGDCVREVMAFLRERVAAAWKAGVPVPRIAVDPGIGFGKRVQDNTALLRSLRELRSLGRPLVVGVSRKSFLGKLSGEESAASRDTETIAATALADHLGADVHRVHDAEAARRTLAVAGGIGRGGGF